MDSNTKQKRTYVRSALICFACTAVCIGIDIRNFIRAGHLYFNFEIGVSIIMYAMLIFMGVRAIRKSKEVQDQ